ncbi:organic hydroperoxide resistance protein [Paenibacillus lautus]|jgi:Ohr subfamily peroxiredoxin|uniref:Organic hydroperoxide resistance protein n=1 Tax=Paenibacillus lautus TaxID=1401 RepID=A0A385TFL7_PAELA|nr:organic hydroperoxide resistance protein [Paenibacillus lautus]AYB42449.1 organic hydroperoxide resistance protein [Paenibacillus lautus]MBY0160850.1 organic hydroperoxide resistance protein [Cytobacillus firmus]MCI1774776.1 organic hydroperoxide resistance protein [Paenibacillus lautus]
MKPLYTADVKVIGGREGSVESTDGVLNHKLSMPKELGGPGGAGTNPEQLFAAGYGACYESALANIARKEGVELKDVVIHSQVSIGKDEGADGFKLAVKLKIEMPGIERSQAEDLAKKAHAFCPYSKATRGNIDVELSVS